jgi:hypothetical protein
VNILCGAQYYVCQCEIKGGRPKKAQTALFVLHCRMNGSPATLPTSADLSPQQRGGFELIALKFLDRRAILGKQAPVLGKRIEPAFRPPRVSFE